MFSPGPTTDDPLAHVFAPPPNESQHDKENRVRAEQEAKKRSDAIDEEINKQRASRKNTKPVKILLLGEFYRCLSEPDFRYSPSDRLRSCRPLGQSESGGFHVHHTPPQ